MNIESRLFSLSTIVEQMPHWHFNVPIYQRLFVWGDDQVRTLLDDLVNAYQRKETVFFLGGTLLVEQESKEAGRHFDLIDGQQRFTTLWLLCQAWQGALASFVTVPSDKITRPRLGFQIRPDVEEFFARLASLPGGQSHADEEGVRRMESALAMMKSVFESHAFGSEEARETHLAGLTDFVFRKVKFVITTVPRETDLNKLFEVINNRGVQLQHHEILKARMLDVLGEDERAEHALVWDACADMDRFIEQTLAGLSGMPASEVTALHERNGLDKPESLLPLLRDRLKAHADTHALDLQTILQSAADQPEESVKTRQDGDAEPSWVRNSIVGFPLFLQHVLRVWLQERGRGDLPRILDKQLLGLFDEHFLGDSPKAEDVRSFIRLLWRLRVLFDRHVIKWVDQDSEVVHLISAIHVSTSNGKRYMSRSRTTDSHQGFSLLQSMLYHSQEITTQYWLTPLLAFMHRNEHSDVQAYFDYLRHLDNHLFGSAAKESLVVRTRAFMEQPWLHQPLVHAAELAARKDNGTQFAHYWFYKLEFVLWFQQKGTDEKWDKFRFTAKSSVEHIGPQTPLANDEDRVVEQLHCFGNLALVSRSVNSEFGNRPYREKRERFRTNNKARLDSLKMALIYGNETWGDAQVLAHQNAMIECMDRYCGSTPGRRAGGGVGLA
jgi:hypothetical protein